MSKTGQISGMTGFARVEGLAEGLSWAWEVKSVNGRGLDLKLRLPAGFDGLEAPMREAAAKLFKRGSLQANLALNRPEAGAGAIQIDHKLVARLIEEGRPYVENGEVKKPSWDGLLAVRGVVAMLDAEALDADAHARLEAALLQGWREALVKLSASRASEGETLSAILGALFDRLDALISSAAETASAAPAAQLERLKQRLAALAPDVIADPQRLAQESALIAQRADTQEELERLRAHAGEARSLLKSADAVGRRYDFLTQELTREANTLCSKSSEIELTRIGLDLKTVIDQIKEQAANVE